MGPFHRLKFSLQLFAQYEFLYIKQLTGIGNTEDNFAVISFNISISGLVGERTAVNDNTAAAFRDQHDIGKGCEHPFDIDGMLVDGDLCSGASRENRSGILSAGKSQSSPLIALNAGEGSARDFYGAAAVMDIYGKNLRDPLRPGPYG